MATFSGVMLMLGLLTLSTCATTSAALLGLQPLSNVVAEVSPDLHKYELQRIGIISFVNQSATPDAGVRMANFFFSELDAYQRYELAPPLHLDEDMELAFTRTAEAVPTEERSSRLRQFVHDLVSRIWPVTSPEPPGQTPPTPVQPSPASQAAPPLDAVLTGVITRYNDRNGSALLVDQPASVAYEVYLISTRDGEILWRARFDETQKPLFENLLLIGRFLKGGAVWQTHDTLARIGLERVVKTFPGIEGTPVR
ncbi:MAG: hypothetical protein HYZ81_24795 [Nitrospinae bacterium]|nr:hypothetical protein [Nitrospinota bacterium]